MSKKNDADVRPSKMDEDELGKYLVRKMDKEIPDGGCPSSELLAGFIEKTLEGEERQAVIDHISRCPVCYRTFTSSVATQQELKSPLYLRKEVLAIAAVLIVVASFLLLRSLQEEPVSLVRSKALELVGFAEWNTISQATWKEDSGYLFGKTRPVQSSAFHVAVHLLDLEIAIRAADSPKAQTIRGEISELLRPIAGRGKIVSDFEHMGNDLAALGELEEETGKFFQDHGAGFYFDFGVWTEQARLAAVLRNQKLLKPSGPRALLEKEEIRKLPVGVGNSLKKIQDILSVGSLSESDYRELERIFQDIIRLV